MSPRRFILAAGLMARGAMAACDPFGVAELFPTRAGGVEYFATSWSRAGAREFSDAADPKDPWFDAGHGQGRYRVDGKGTLTASGDIVRMYVHHPDRKSEWGENLEITVFVTRMKETRPVSYSGPQIFARTNHGTYTGSFGSESKTLCDDRGLGAKLNIDGAWAFEKETAHGKDKGYATAGFRRYWPDGFPIGRPVGIKYVLRNVMGAGGKVERVHLELYTEQGGAWIKVTEYDDRGAFGLGSSPCAPGADPAMIHERQGLLARSETGRPETTVYFRHEYAEMKYQKLSVREIDPLSSQKDKP